MEAILNFFEQYWGYTLFGGVTVGSLVAFAIAAFKLISTVVKQKKEAKEKDAEHQSVVKTLVAQINEQKALYGEAIKKQIQDAQYTAKVQAVTFEALSYLIMASKLSTEDKLTLTQKFSTLTNTTPEDVENAYEVANEKVQEKVKEAEDIKNVVVATVDKAKSLLDKYNV